MSRFVPAQVLNRPWRRRPGRLTPEQIRCVRALPWTQGSGQALAKEFGVSPSLISNIRRGLIYKREQPQKTYHARVTDRGERYWLGTFLTADAAQNAIDRFKRSGRWPRGSVERTNATDGRFRARLSLGIYDTRWAAELACARAIARLQQ